MAVDHALLRALQSGPALQLQRCLMRHCRARAPDAG